MQFTSPVWQKAKVGTGWQYPACDQIPSTYKVIPYGWDKKEMGEYVPKPKIDNIF